MATKPELEKIAKTLKEENDKLKLELENKITLEEDKKINKLKEEDEVLTNANNEKIQSEVELLKAEIKKIKSNPASNNKEIKDLDEEYVEVIFLAPSVYSHEYSHNGASLIFNGFFDTDKIKVKNLRKLKKKFDYEFRNFDLLVLEDREEILDELGLAKTYKDNCITYNTFGDLAKFGINDIGTELQKYNKKIQRAFLAYFVINAINKEKGFTDTMLMYAIDDALQLKNGQKIQSRINSNQALINRKNFTIS